MRFVDADIWIKGLNKIILDDEMPKSAKEWAVGMIAEIKNQSTAYDLESVIEQLEKKRDECYSKMKKEEKETDYFSEHIYEEYHNKAMAFNEAVEIAKSGIITGERGEENE